jgi:hypothetical protein
MAVKIQPKCPRAVEVLAWVISRVITLRILPNHLTPTKKTKDNGNENENERGCKVRKMED